MKGRIIKINRFPAAIAAIAAICIIIYLYNVINYSNSQVYSTFGQTDSVSMRKLLIASIQAAEMGGLEVLEVAKSRNLKEHSKGKTDEGVNDPFTAADGKSHCVMKQGLLRIFPHVKIQSEEDNVKCVYINRFDLDPTVLHETVEIHDELVKIEDVTIWIDPLDATKEFTEELYQYVTTMVCVAVKGKPVIGVIHDPFNKQTAWAWVDRSMSEYLKSIYTRPSLEPMKHPVITVSRSHAGNVKGLIHAVFGETSEILTAAGAGYKVLQVIANNATAYLHSTKIKKWDICAGDAIITALGGSMTNLDNEHIRYDFGESAVNENGLLVTLTNHEYYIEKLMAYRSDQSPFHSHKNSQRR